MSNQELGPFIRSRREAVTPAEVGLPAGSRRRTPGLRRSELATLAGISVDYLIRIEQGRDRRPSAQVVAAIADALHLDEGDRNRLRQLTLMNLGEELCPAIMPPAQTIRPTVRAILDGLEPAPALVLNHLADVLAWTSTYERIAQAVGILDATPPNLVRFTFLDPRARTVYPDWDRVADEQVANLRAAQRFHEPREQDLIDTLSRDGGSEFTTRWDAHSVDRKGAGVKRIVHPEVGELRLSFETLQLADRDDQRLVIYLPADDSTGAALDQLAGRGPGGLRSVPL